MLKINDQRLAEEIQESLARMEEIGMCDETFCMLVLEDRNIEIHVKVTSEEHDFLGEAIDGVAEIVS